MTGNSARRQPNALATMGWLIVMGAAWGLEFSMLKLAVEAGLPEIGILMVALVLVVVAFGARSLVLLGCLRSLFGIGYGRLAADFQHCVAVNGFQ